ncbi:MAG: hydrogenase maturation nickel metallochaperone HypA [Hydrogenophilus thermoluteolus]|jgi:hydrogenase nickel incorporation protein HypA/HybF|nr:hydrogenase maturation nickel metallochaperone HypA [Hydrogenophilus thermoluteolus]MBW7656002.1 hydrogenase maturation nickel metallochaperone HypA [Hydrogenophilus thermoluteolus]HCO78071.1 hydrogenase maturation nickel metallochaperone HypA [Rhodocyclaceae bacterium]HNQ48313.1 hydrogenase maturation nickel metallochaperone HypA [Hydrogenophilus thermoluteolus]HNU20470.1 hydrogenase maturation nickel metallochaperone HypA [Hydrogenophilus thermoluteolus]
MHEMALAESVVRLAEETATAEGARRIRSVIVEIGALSCVEPEALTFCFDAVSRGTLAEGAELRIERIDGAAYCWRCERTVPIAARTDPCPECGGYQLQPSAGTEMRVQAIEIE